MDLSVVAASIGSFVVSERVIRAKASVMVVLASVAVYDLCRHSHDPASLRVYRGPAMVAFTMSCVAASLRIWRRSGVACDELLFLPGTPYAAMHGVSCPAVDAAKSPPPKTAAGGGGGGGTSRKRRGGVVRAGELELTMSRRNHDSSPEEMEEEMGAGLISNDEEAALRRDRDRDREKVRDRDRDKASRKYDNASDGVDDKNDDDNDDDDDIDGKGDELRDLSSSSPPDSSENGLRKDSGANSSAAPDGGNGNGNGNGPLIVPLAYDSGPDAAAGTPLTTKGAATAMTMTSPRRQDRRSDRQQQQQRDAVEAPGSEQRTRGQGQHRRRFSDTDLPSPGGGEKRRREEKGTVEGGGGGGESDEAGGVVVAGMRSRRYTHDQIFGDGGGVVGVIVGAHDTETTRAVEADAFHAGTPALDGSRTLPSLVNKYRDENLGLLEEGGHVSGGGGGGGSRGSTANYDDAHDDDYGDEDDGDRRRSDSLLDSNEGLRDESMIRYLLCSQGERLGERLRRRRYRRLRGGAASPTEPDSPPSPRSPIDSGGGGSRTGLGTSLSSPGGADGAGIEIGTGTEGMMVLESGGDPQSTGGRPGPPKRADALDATYSPSGPSVAGAAVDLCLPVLFNFHMFVVLSNSRSGGGGRGSSGSGSVSGSDGSGGGSLSGPDDGGMDPRVLPLIFLSILFVRSVVPPKGRMRFWSTIKYTACAPLYSVYFRDAFIGDVMTSLVKPIMDLAYCVFYYFISMYMILSVSRTLDEAGEILEKSWTLHNIVLPAIAVLPLWWKFLQTLRQAWDHNRRWPHLGNSFKYLTAAMVVLYGMGHREGKRSWWWVTAFVLATMYQIWWDVAMDWELLVVVPKRRDGTDGGARQSPTMAESTRLCGCAETCGCNCISSIPASSSILLPLHRHIVQPITDGWRRVVLYLTTHTVRLRSRRLYKRDQFYRRVFMYNAASRFLWMLSFIPAYHFSRDGKEIQTFTIDAKTYVGAAISVAEIVRRCLWGILKLELETIKVTDYTPVPTEEDGIPQSALATADERFGGKAAHMSQSGVDMVLSALRFESQSLMVQSACASASPVAGRGRCNATDAFWRGCFLAELVLWAAAFIGLGAVSVWVI